MLLGFGVLGFVLLGFVHLGIADRGDESTVDDAALRSSHSTSPPMHPNLDVLGTVTLHIDLETRVGQDLDQTDSIV